MNAVKLFAIVISPNLNNKEK
uniref:Uncharacterized protein n=1 Tax=Heterorhabditis bacteriophora TaxID=37862 RepID=A0A1I7WHT2_HETBA